MSKHVLTWCLVPLLLLTGCQSGKWSMPSFPKMSLWKDGGPKLFAKKDKELPPPSRHFADDSPEELAVNAPPTDMPSKSLTPYGAPSTAAKNPPSSNTPASNPGAEFETPAVDKFAANGTPQLRKPYSTTPATPAPAGGNNSLVKSDAASKESSAFDPSAFGGSSSTGASSSVAATPSNNRLLNSADNAFGPPSNTAAPRSSAGSPGLASTGPSALTPRTPTSPTTSNSLANLQPNPVATSPSTALAPNSQALQPQRPNPLATTGGAAGLAGTASPADNTSPANYPRTPQSQNAYENLLAGGSNGGLNPAPTSPSRSIPNPFLNEAPGPAANPSLSQVRTQPMNNEFPATKSQAYVSSGSANSAPNPLAPSPSPSSPRVAELPSGLKSDSNYSPGSIRRVSF